MLRILSSDRSCLDTFEQRKVREFELVVLNHLKCVARASLRGSLHECLKIVAVIHELKVTEVKDVSDDVAQGIVRGDGYKNELNIYSTVYIKCENVLEVQVERLVR